MIPVAKPYLTKDEAKAASDVILSGWVTQGPKVEEFEQKFAEYVGTKYAVAVSSCTTALHLAMIVAGVKSGDEVICPSLSFIATANAIVYAGAKPVFAEVDETYNIDPKHAEKLITKNTVAILIVHQMGFPADIDAFKKICEKYNLKLIEDAACAAGSSYKGKKIGSHSDLVCFSFHPRKVITTGDGGMITTSNKKYYERLKHLRQHGMSVNDRVRHLSKKIIKEEYLEVGYNYRMTDIQAAIGIEQLKKLDWLVSERRKIAHMYNVVFRKINCVSIMHEPSNTIFNYQSYPLYLKKNCRISHDKLMQELLNRGISTRRGIMTAHREKAYAQYKNVKLPVSEDLSDNSLLLPLFIEMKNTDVKYILSTIKKLLI
jgi:dTDP-4-amino-4,6-dideoxygalactose transaminase